jgi:hypothetical protein
MLSKKRQPEQFPLIGRRQRRDLCAFSSLCTEFLYTGMGCAGLEAEVREFTASGETDEGRHILMDVSRYLAGHSPTERAALQTADIARRLMRGGELHQKEGASS